MDYYYLAAQLQHAVHWMDEEDSWESILLRGTCGGHSLPEVLMMGARAPDGLPYAVQMVCKAWDRTVRMVMKQAPFAEGMSI